MNEGEGLINRHDVLVRVLKTLTIAVGLVCIPGALVLWMCGLGDVAYSVFFWGAVGTVSVKIVRVALERPVRYQRSIVLSVAAVLAFYLVMRTLE